MIRVAPIAREADCGWNPLARVAWITWERQRRNAGIAGALGVQLFEFDIRGTRVQRYVRTIPATVALLWRIRPRVLIVQNPSIVLAAEALVASRLLGFRLVVDAHNAGLRPREGRSPMLLRAAAMITRCAQVTVVSNRCLEPVVRSYGGRAIVVPDKIPTLPSGRVPPTCGGRDRVTVVSTFARDEPYEAVVKAARLLRPETMLFVTGKVPPAAKGTCASAPSNVVFTGFLPEEDYVGLLRASDVVVDLTLRDDCLVCGAYEAVAAGKPMVLSDTEANRVYFRRGAVYADNSPEGVAAAIGRALDDRAHLEAEVQILRGELERDFRRRIRHFSRYLRRLEQLP